MGAVLALNSHYAQTSPVLRGAWVLETLLGTPVPPPPANVPPLDPDRKLKQLSVREKLEQHRADPACSACHKLMDPIGFALENFDADGSWRTKQGGQGGVPIDASATLWDGTKVNGPAELRQALGKYSGQFVRNITERLMTFALGRGVEYEDMPVIRGIVRDADQDNDRFMAILMGIIKSGPFQMRVKQVESN
jgi:hypothetical protein